MREPFVSVLLGNEWRTPMSEELPEHTIDVTQVIAKPEPAPDHPEMQTDNGSGIIQNGDWDQEPIQFSVDEDVRNFLAQLEKSGKRYRILKLLAAGGFGRVFLAQDRVLGRKAVIKSLREDLLHRPDTVKKFIAEAKLNAQLDHPAIVSLFSLDSDNEGGLHLAMQLINGITLKEYLRRSREQQEKQHYSQKRYKQLLQERLEMFLHVCDAIEYCHSRRIIHCDLKPDNIMIGRYGEVYVMDWGIACLEGTDRKGNVTGTPSYMAPEALCDGATTQQTDVFALGMILNEIATLRRCVSGSSSEEIAQKICRGEFEPSVPLDPRRQIAPALSAIIEKARALDPRDRYPDVRHLASDVRHFLFNEEVKACPDSPLQKLMRLMYRHRYVTLSVIVGLFCLFAAVAIYALWRENRMVRQVGREMVRSLKLQGNTERLASELNSRLLSLQNQLKALSTSLGIEMIRPDSVKEKVRFYPAAAFDSKSGTPVPGLVKVPFYDKEVSWEHAAYFKPEAISPEVLKEWGSRLRSLHSLRLTHIFENIHGQDVYTHSKKENMRLLLERGTLLRRITYILDNGIALRFPGMKETVSSPGEFQSDWIRNAYKKYPRRLLWSPPYVDSAGHVVISCWRPILDAEDKSIGVIGFEICFHELVRPIWEQAKKERFRSTYILLDSEDRQIFSSADHGFEQSHGKASSPSMTLRPEFRDPELLRQIRENQSPQFTTVFNGRPTRVSRARISNANWTLIQLVPLDATDVVDNSLDAEKLSVFRREILWKMQ